MEEEGELFRPADLVMRYIDKTHEQRVEERTQELREAKEAVELTKEKLENAYKDLEQVHKAESRDLELAARIQTSYFPKKVSSVPGWDISFIFRPAAKVSGDFYDFHISGGELRGVSLIDVSGHGIGPGLLTLLARSIISQQLDAGDKSPLGTVVGQINQKLIKELEVSSNYLTGVVLRFTGNKVEYVNAGHTDILFHRKERALIVQPRNGNFQGPVLGMKGDTEQFPVLRFSVMKDDLLLLFTDCFVEGRNRDGEEYGIERIRRSLGTLVSEEENSEELLGHLLGDFYSFTDKEKIRDDLTVILLKWTGP
jgi:sigma-B regulation protein RsbU (phosphoserine phosphatase)